MFFHIVTDLIVNNRFVAGEDRPFPRTLQAKLTIYFQGSAKLPRTAEIGTPAPVRSRAAAPPTTPPIGFSIPGFEISIGGVENSIGGVENSIGGVEKPIGGIGGSCLPPGLPGAVFQSAPPRREKPAEGGLRPSAWLALRKEQLANAAAGLKKLLEGGI